VFTRPPELAEEAIASSLAQHWGVDATSLVYEPVGYGAHHWRATSAGGDEHFLTVHDLSAHRHDDGETEDDVFGRLTASFDVARALRDEGLDFVLAPTPTTDGHIVERLDQRFTLAAHPYLEGRPAGPDGTFSSTSERLAALELVAAVHRHRGAAVNLAAADDLVVPHVEEIPAAVDDLGRVWDSGPYGELARAHLEEHAAGAERLMVGYETLAEQVRERRDEAVVTHGEPHAGNVFVVADQHLLIDWDTALFAVPERDLWHLDTGDGSIADAYRELTGVSPSPAALDLYRLWWDLTETGQYVGRLRRPHSDTTDMALAWEGLQEYLDPAARWPGMAG
jgi:spectinomycin phosphotransferase/16S rRNA (guanine(1405)-N(7))-methyltransferase